MFKFLRTLFATPSKQEVIPFAMPNDIATPKVIVLPVQGSMPQYVPPRVRIVPRGITQAEAMRLDKLRSKLIQQVDDYQQASLADVEQEYANRMRDIQRMRTQLAKEEWEIQQRAKHIAQEKAKLERAVRKFNRKRTGR